MILFVNYLGKMRGYPQFSFWISITLAKIYIPCVIINRGKNTIEFVGTVLKKAVDAAKGYSVIRLHTLARDFKTKKTNYGNGKESSN